MILTEKESKELIAKVLSTGSADEIRVNLRGVKSGNIRFALNSVSTSGEEDSFEIMIRACFGKRHASASSTEMDDASLKRLVKTAEELARYSPEDPEYVPELGPQDFLRISPYFESTAKTNASVRIRPALSSIEPAARKELVAAGFFLHDHSFYAIGNNKGLSGYYQSTDSSFRTTVRTAGGDGSGWGGDNSRKIEEVGYEQASARAIEKAETSRNPKVLEPGAYPVILEPRAAADFLNVAFLRMAGRDADEGRSFFSKPGGGNKIGERIAGENITIRSDPADPSILGDPFETDGLPAKKNVWIEKGVLRQLSYDRYWAQKQGKEPTGAPANIVIEGGNSSLDELIAETDRAVLVTRLWYIRFVDPQTLLFTGLTRDGTFLVESGKIKHAVRNFRFNESPIAFLKKVTGMSKPVRVGGSLIPAIRASEFSFSSLSQAI